MRLETLDRIGFPNLSIRLMCSMLGELGLDSAPAIRAAGVDRALIDDPNGRISGRQELDFQHAYVGLTGHSPEVWFRTGLRYRMLCYGPYGFVMMTARTLRRSLELSSLFGDLHYSLMSYTNVAAPGGPDRHRHGPLANPRGPAGIFHVPGPGLGHHHPARHLAGPLPAHPHRSDPA